MNMNTLKGIAIVLVSIALVGLVCLSFVGIAWLWDHHILAAWVVTGVLVLGIVVGFGRIIGETL